MILHGMTEEEREALLSCMDFALGMTYVRDKCLRDKHSEREWQKLAILRAKVMIADLA